MLNHGMDARRHAAGNVLIIVLVFALLIAGIAIPTMLQGVRTQQATGAGLLAAKLLMVAESGLNYNFVELEKDTVYAVKNEIDFDWNAIEGVYEWNSEQPLQLAGTTASQRFHLKIQYLQGANSVEFANRSTPTEQFDRIKVVSTATAGGMMRRVVAWYAFRFGFRGAIVSDSVPTNSGGEPKTMAKKGHIVFDGEGRIDEHVVYGDLQSNGEIVYFQTNTPSPLTTANATSYLLDHRGELTANLGGTPDEILDFTDPSSQQQLFDFLRFEAAAARGAGAVYNGLTAFQNAMNLANTTNEVLEGIIVVKIDPAVEGQDPALAIVGGINITGTLLFDFADGTNSNYKVVLDDNLPVHINAADLTGLILTDESTYASGYPGTYVDPSKRPHTVDITPDGFENFTVDDDLPAIMFNSGTVDFHGELNICGVIYGPAFIEIENHGNLMYINGALFGGGGVYLRANSAGIGAIVVRHDSNTTDNLALFENTGALLTRIGYAIMR